MNTYIPGEIVDLSPGDLHLLSSEYNRSVAFAEQGVTDDICFLDQDMVSALAKANMPLVAGDKVVVEFDDIGCIKAIMPLEPESLEKVEGVLAARRKSSTYVSVSDLVVQQDNGLRVSVGAVAVKAFKAVHGAEPQAGQKVTAFVGGALWKGGSIATALKVKG